MNSKFDKEFYTNLDDALHKFKSLFGLCKNVHLIKNKYSAYYVVLWEK